MSHLPADAEPVPDALHPVPDLADERPAEFARRGDDVVLRACQTDGDWHFPPTADDALTDVGPAGRLYSFSTIHVSSTRDVPYTLGYVDFPAGLRVLAVVKGDVAGLACDADVVLRAGDGDWWVEPAAGQGGGER